MTQFLDRLLETIMSRHPALLGYSQTFERSFPLLLIIGREPNSNETKPSFGLGVYDFDDRENGGTTCSFWNTSYAVLGDLIGLSASGLKSICRAKSASPLVYGDIFPYPIRNAVSDKASPRKAISSGEMDAHASELFSHKEVINRVGLVLFSGLTRFPAHREHVQKLEQAADDRSLSWFHVPFFYGTQTPALKAALEGQPQAKAIMSAFVAGSRQA